MNKLSSTYFSRLPRVTALLWCLCYSNIVLTQVLPSQQGLAAFPVEEAVSQMKFYYNDQVGLSPDGQWIVYAVQDPKRYQTPRDPRYKTLTERGSSTYLQGCDIWIANTNTGESKNLTGGQGTSWAPIWSPDGSYIAFFSDRGGQARPWLWEKFSGHLKELSDVIPVSDLDTHPRWTPDSKNLLVVALPDGETVEEEITRHTELSQRDDKGNEQEVTVEVYVSSSKASSSLRDYDEDKDSSSRYISDIAMINVSDGQTKRLVKGISPAGDVEVSPDGTRLAFFDFQRKGSEPLTRLYNLTAVELPDGRSRVLSAGVKMHGDISLSWSPDSRLLSYIAGQFVLRNRGVIVTVVPGECFIVSAESGAVRPATLVTHPKFDGTRPPLWAADGRSLVFLAENNSVWTISVLTGAARQVAEIAGRTLREIVTSAQAPGRYWSPDSQSLYLMTLDEGTKQFGFWKINLVDGHAAKLIEGDSRYSRHYGGFWGSSRGQRIIYTAENPTNPQEVWVADADFRDPKQITHMHSSLEQHVMGKPRLITWRSDDGDELHGALLLPVGYEKGKRYPLVVHIYGGEDMSRYINQFGGFEPEVLNWQLLATRGYAVLQPDSVINVGTAMQDLAKSILPGINKVIELGVADPNLIGVFGHSYGGYSALALIAQSTRFKVAVCYAGYGDIFSHYGDMYEHGDAMWIESTEQRGGKMGGSPWQYRDRYIENSPYFYLDRIQTPLLIIHGADDHPATWIEGTFVGLRRLGKDATYLKYEGEGHVIEGRANHIDSTNRVLAWFDKYLRTAAPTAGLQVSSQ